MSHNPLLGPVIVLVAWTLVMMCWMAAARLPAMKKAERKPPFGGRGQDLEGILPREVNWKAHNYAHLMEQPTIFYAIVLVLVAMDDRMALNLALAWAYVVLRVLHSIIQATVNIVFPWRFGTFILASLCLLALTLHAAIRFWS